jgi:hypothetical protein
MPVDTGSKTARIQTNHTGVLPEAPHVRLKNLTVSLKCLFSNKYPKQNSPKEALQGHTKIQNMKI